MTPEEFEQVIGKPLTAFAHQCHAASIQLVKSGYFGPKARVLRGTCRGVMGQHSWVGICDKTEVYRHNIYVYDPTLWSYTGADPEVWEGKAITLGHRPHGHGSIFQWGRPDHPTDKVIDLAAPEGGWSPQAETFLDMLGPLDRRGWMVLFDAPMGDWPASEILEQASKTELAPFIPIDRLGMLTDLNPSGLYLP